MEQVRVKIDKRNCVGCGMCAKVCVAHNIAINHKKAESRLDDCLMCGHCTAIWICPKKAITIRGYPTVQLEKSGDIHLNPDDILEVIRFRRTIRKFEQKKFQKK